MNNIQYSAPEEQVEKLKNQHLIIEDEELAIEMLNCFGYSNLIKSYREPYTIVADGSRIYRSGVTFEQIFSLYLLDKNLRNAVMAAMIDLEEHIKEAAADVVAKSFGTHPNDYLQFRKYSNKRKRKHQFTLRGILDIMENTLNTDKDPIHHYNTEHGIVPPWILFKSIYFSTIVNYIDQFKTPERDQLVCKLYPLEELGMSLEAGRILMMDTLFVCLEYRNLAAHGGRTYNYQYNYPLRTAEIFNFDSTTATSGIGFFLFLLSLLDYQVPYQRLDSVLTQEVNRHCNEFPQDVTYLGQILNIDIHPQEVVWISPKSQKFHINQHCSGIVNASKIPLEKAKEQGYIPCKRCI